MLAPLTTFIVSLCSFCFCGLIGKATRFFETSGSFLQLCINLNINDALIASRAHTHKPVSSYSLDETLT